MPKIRRSTRIHSQNITKSNQTEISNKTGHKNETEVKTFTCNNSETASDSEESQECFACKQKYPPIRRYPENNWIQCDNCDEWWHVECACVTKEDNDKFIRYKIGYTCALCVLKGSPWIYSNHNLSAKHTNFTEPSQQIKTDRSNSNSKQTNSPEYIAETCKTDKDCFIVIDNIPSPKKYRSSVDIRKEIRKFPDIVKPTHSFSLSKGGIALQYEDKRQVDKTLQNWPEEAFGTESSPHKARGIKEIKSGFVKNISTSVSVKDIEEIFRKKCKVKLVSRLHYRNSRKPMPVVKIDFLSEEDLQKAKSVVLEFQINGKAAYIEEERRVKVIRCYNCHRFGHIRRICTYTPRCGICASEEHSELECTNPDKCANCEGGHTASSKYCPVYQQVFQLQRSSLLC